MSKNKENGLINYFQESVIELKKVTWPTKNQAIKMCVTVLTFCFAAAILVGLIDFVLSTGYTQLIFSAQQM